MFQFKSKGRKKLTSQVVGYKAREFFLTWERIGIFVLCRPLVDWLIPPTLRWAPCCAQSTYLNVNLIQNTLVEIPKIILSQISGHPIAQTHWPSK
jgi:hypothetical protein